MATRTVGKRNTRLDARGKVTGETLFPGDLSTDDMLYMKILFSDRAHARITAIDTREAEAYPGVVAVLTAKDVPVNEYGLIMFDQPVLCGPGSAKEGADIVRTVLDQVALVIAESEEAAAEARDLIDVTYEDLPPVFDPLEAMEDGAPQLHSDKPGNVVTHYRIRYGDVEAAWDEADVIVEDTYTTSWQEHAYLQPEAGLGYIDDEGRLTVEVAGQWTHEDQQQIYHALDLPPEQVRVIYPAIGGAFGGREDMSVQIVLALAAWKVGRPVKIIWSREESMIGHHKRHPYHIEQRWGAKKDGTLVAVEARVISDSGAYAYTSTKVLGNATLMCTGPYYFPNANVDAYTIYTNNLPSGAFRGFGGPQAAFSAESQMNKLAEKLGMDPVEIRLKNALRDGVITPVGTPLPDGVTIGETVRAAAERSRWQDGAGGWHRPDLDQPPDPSKRRGIGIACGFKNVGFSFGAPEKCDAIIELYGGAEVERAVVYHAGADVGQGAHTAFVMMAAEALGLDPAVVELVPSDTATSGDAGSASASRMTFMAGNAIRGAAEAALDAWRGEDRPAVGKFTYHPPKTSMFAPETGYCYPNFSYGYVAEIVEIEVDVETGQIEVVNVVCANDVGRAINPQLIEGQIEGAVVQAYGYSTMEHFQMAEGRVLTPYFSNYLIPGVLDVPRQIEPVILENPDPNGPWGARGMAEMPFIPFAPAIASALHDATGIWFDDLPLVPDRLVARFRQAGLGK
jgi:CO/xanthine dehydrogenase Mo-binding subunit